MSNWTMNALKQGFFLRKVDAVKKIKQKIV